MKHLASVFCLAALTILFTATLFTATLTATLTATVTSMAGEPRHGMSLFGELRHDKDFAHFDYADPDAVKGGTLRISGGQTFDNLNPYITKGAEPGQINQLYDTLMVRGFDEPSAQYGLVAETIEVADDFTWAAYTLRREARFHDGYPITADDVVFTFNMLKEVGSPQWRQRYASVARIEKTGSHSVTFYFSGTLSMEPVLMTGELPVLPAHYWADREFDKTTLKPPLASGPYVVRNLSAGRYIEYERVKDYWAEDLAVTRGHNNFDIIRIETFRDLTVAREAFKSGDLHFFGEGVSKDWATSYEFDAVKDGRVIKETYVMGNPKTADSYLINLRKPIFSDVRVREAMSYAFDFEWINAHLYYGLYSRSDSFFSGSELAHQGMPTPQELELLEPLRDQLPERVFGEAYVSPVTRGDGNNRSQLRYAAQLLDDAGYHVNAATGIREHEDTGDRLIFEILVVTAPWERVSLAYIVSLEKIGIKARVRLVDQSQYILRLATRDFDLTILRIPRSITPGNEIRRGFSSEYADIPYSSNVLGVKDPAIDSLIESLIGAESRDELMYASRAFDRALMWNFYSVPGYFSPGARIVYWDRFGRAERGPRYALEFPEIWWYDAERDAQLGVQRQARAD